MKRATMRRLWYWLVEAVLPLLLLVGALGLVARRDSDRFVKLQVSSDGQQAVLIHVGQSRRLFETRWVGDVDELVAGRVEDRLVGQLLAQGEELRDLGRDLQASASRVGKWGLGLLLASVGWVALALALRARRTRGDPLTPPRDVALRMGGLLLALGLAANAWGRVQRWADLDRRTALHWAQLGGLRPASRTANFFFAPPEAVSSGPLAELLRGAFGSDADIQEASVMGRDRRWVTVSRHYINAANELDSARPDGPGGANPDVKEMAATSLALCDVATTQRLFGGLSLALLVAGALFVITGVRQREAPSAEGVA